MFSGPLSAPVSAMNSRLSQPALGPASRIQPTAPRYGGMMNVPRIDTQISPFAGMSVRDTAHASGTPNTSASAAAERPSTSELKSAAT